MKNSLKTRQQITGAKGNKALKKTINPFYKTAARKFVVKDSSSADWCATLNPAFNDPQHNLSLYSGNCIEVLHQIANADPSGCIDMIFADPPYFLSNGGISCQAGKMVSVNKGNWDKSHGPEVNHEFNRKWLEACQKVLRPNGTIWVSGTAHVIHSIGFAMQQLGYKILNDITWVKPNPPPNLSCRYFTHATETVIWAAKNANSRHLFHYQEMRRMNNGKQMKSIWPILPPATQEKEFGKHPTQKPLELLKRILLASSNPGDLILDPFMGSGTTGVAAVQLNRKFVGIELDSGYIATAIKRLQQAANLINREQLPLAK